MTKPTRDLRLDLVRGVVMLIIFIAHVPGNSWEQFIPARFGFSSAAEVFVFCSGYATALAFGAIFVRSGHWAGTSRILFRIWQIYRAHFSLFLIFALISILGRNWQIGTGAAMTGLMSGLFAGDALKTILSIATLTTVPNSLNILPLYIVLLAEVPVMMALSRVSRWLVFALVAGQWLAVQFTGVNLAAGIMPEREWFFDPFAWQLIFFTGYAFGMGWLPRPSLGSPALMRPGIAFLIASIPINFWAFTDNIPILRAIRDTLIPNGIVATTHLHALRYAHFLVLAYVTLSVLARRPRLPVLAVLRPIVAVGQQSLVAFIASMTLAWIMGIALEAAGRSLMTDAVANVLGMAAIVAIARGAALLKSARPRHQADPADRVAFGDLVRWGWR